jgi:hypothetical protein
MGSMRCWKRRLKIAGRVNVFKIASLMGNFGIFIAYVNRAVLLDGGRKLMQRKIMSELAEPQTELKENHHGIHQ